MEVKNQDVGRIVLPPNSLEENHFCFIQLLVALVFLVWEHISDLCLCCHMSFSCVLLLSLIRKLVNWFSVHTGNLGWSHFNTLNFIISAKILFPNKVTFSFQGMGITFFFFFCQGQISNIYFYYTSAIITIYFLSFFFWWTLFNPFKDGEIYTIKTLTTENRNDYIYISQIRI